LQTCTLKQSSKIKYSKKLMKSYNSQSQLHDQRCTGNSAATHFATQETSYSQRNVRKICKVDPPLIGTKSALAVYSQFWLCLTAGHASPLYTNFVIFLNHVTSWKIIAIVCPQLFSNLWKSV
jgi:hypothetical protein